MEHRMPYTLSLHGVVIGETEFEHKGLRPRQHAGIFRPTELGIAVLPQITGMFAASLAFTRVVERRKAEVETADGVIGLLENTPEGQKLIEHAKVIDQLELRDPNGDVLPIESIAVSNLQELARLAASKLGKASVGDGAPRYLISATIRDRGAPLQRDALPGFGPGRLASHLLQ
jgi:hypothetical protein